MITKREIILSIENDNHSLDDKVELLELLAYKVGIMTISEMARKEGKSPTGIRNSKRYGKVNIGGQLMAVKGKLHNLPF